MVVGLTLAHNLIALGKEHVIHGLDGEPSLFGGYYGFEFATSLKHGLKGAPFPAPIAFGPVLPTGAGKAEVTSFDDVVDEPSAQFDVFVAVPYRHITMWESEIFYRQGTEHSGCLVEADSFEHTGNGFAVDAVAFFVQ